MLEIERILFVYITFCRCDDYNVFWEFFGEFIDIKFSDVNKMNTNDYKCVNCGETAAALYKSYGPTVLKLTKCKNCKGIVDKYVEYDPVIVMIDLVLMSKEAQRHVLFNTEFKSFWKLLIILMMLETYGVWRCDSLFNIVINTVCGIQSNSTINTTHLNLPVNISIPESWLNNCEAWAREEKGDEADLFIWEKDFYIKFTAIFAGVVAFILTVQSSMQLMKPVSLKNRVTISRLVKAFSLAHVSILFTLPMLVWGTDSSAETRALHLALVFMYSFAVFTNVFTVLYECPLGVTILILTVSNITKYATSFHITPYLRNVIT